MRDDSLYLTPRHPIRVVAERTGLSPDVLRAWERRHGVVRPGRTDAGRRLYSDAHIDRLTLLAKTARTGRALSQTTSLPDDELRQLVQEDAEVGAARPTRASEYRERAFAAVADLAPERLRAVLRAALLSLGAPTFLDDVVTPLLQTIGTAWHAGEIEIAHEHAASAVVRGVVGWLVDHTEVPDDVPRVVVACLAHEQHELGAALAAAAAAQDGWRVTYLGPDVPAAQIAAAARHHEADVVGISIVAPEQATATSELQALRRELPRRTALLAGGAGVSALGAFGDGITPVRDLAHWRALLRTLAPARSR
jgi:DNA-binding transcriptional MerR regulator